MNLPPDENFFLRYPGVMLFGCGARHRLNDILSELVATKPIRALVVCAGSMVRAGVLDALRTECGQRIVASNAAIPSDPPVPVVDQLVNQLRHHDANVVIGIGGGSVLDAAKAAALLAVHPDRCIDYFHSRSTLNGPGLPYLALPTTAGSGAEITPNAVLTDPARPGVKKSLRSPWMVPAAAIVDPELTLSLPPEQTANSGLDALTQAIEAYLSRGANAVSTALAAEATALLMTHLPTAWQQGDNLAARSQVAKGSLLSAMAFSQSGLGAVHALAHPLGALLTIAHGRICAILLPHLLAWNAPVCQERLTTLAQACACQDATEFVARVRGLCQSLQIPPDLRRYNLSEAKIQLVLDNCRSNSMKTNPRPMRDADIVALLQDLTARPESS